MRGGVLIALLSAGMSAASMDHHPKALVWGRCIRAEVAESSGPGTGVQGCPSCTTSCRIDLGGGRYHVLRRGSDSLVVIRDDIRNDASSELTVAHRPAIELVDMASIWYAIGDGSYLVVHYTSSPIDAPTGRTRHYLAAVHCEDSIHANRMRLVLDDEIAVDDFQGREKRARRCS